MEANINEPAKSSGQELNKKPASLQQQPGSSPNAIDTAGSKKHVTTRIRTLKRTSANPTKKLQPDDDDDDRLSQSALEEMEERYHSPLTWYPDRNTVVKLAIEYDVPSKVIDKWFEGKRSLYMEKEKERVVKHFEEQRKKQEKCSQQLSDTHHNVTQQVDCQVYDSTTADQQPARPYFTERKLHYLEELFKKGTHYPDNLPQLAMKLSVSEQHLDDWFEEKRDAWKIEQANVAYTRMLLQANEEEQQEKERQHQEHIKAMEAIILSTEASQLELPEATNEPLVRLLLYDVSNKPSLTELKFPDNKEM